MSSTVKPNYIHLIPITMMRDASEFRQAITTLYGDDWVSTEKRGSDYLVTVTRATPPDLKKWLQEAGVLRSDGETAEFENRLWTEEGNGRTAING